MNIKGGNEDLLYPSGVKILVLLSLLDGQQFEQLGEVIPASQAVLMSPQVDRKVAKRKFL